MGEGEMRVGIGYDSHPLVRGRKLVLGGVEIPSDRGLLGWSDADVAIHSIIDALCGAADLGDIGTRFPSEESKNKGISSLLLLGQVSEMVRVKGYEVVNIDTTIVAQSPRLSQFIPGMRDKISRALGLEPAQITVKATTTNGLGFVGRDEGVASQSVALVRS